MADLSAVEKRMQKSQKLAKSGDKVARAEVEVYEKVVAGLNDGKPVSQMSLTDGEKEHLKDMHLLTNKAMMYIANVSEDDAADASGNAHVQKLMEQVAPSPVICISAAI